MPEFTRWTTSLTEQRHKPTLLKSCVVSVAAKHGGDTSRAFAICTAALQRSGALSKGSHKLTAKGRKSSKRVKRPKALTARYEKLLAANRQESVDEVAALLSEDYRLLAGLTETTEAPMGSVPAWEIPGTDVPGAAPVWKRVLSPEGFEPEPGSQFVKEGDEAAATKALEAALLANTLPMSDGEERQASPKEFLYQGRHVDENGRTVCAHFKHRDTRNLIHLDVLGQTLLVPVQRKLFQYGTFDKVEHSETFSRLRILAGIGDL